MNEKAEVLNPAEEIERLTKQNQALERLVRKDFLTGLDNRRSFREEMHRAIAGAIRSGKPLSLIFADIDNFKLLNDAYGHRAGDQTLIEVSDTLKRGVRETDRACRYGGEEFTVILPDTALADAVGVSERLRKYVEDSTIVTATFGVSSFIQTNPVTERIPEEEIQQTINQLIETADKAMYEAKTAGRNGTGFIKNGEIAVLGKLNQTSPKMVVRHQTPLEPALKA